MINSIKKVSFDLLNWYQKLPVKNKKIVNKAFFFKKNKLRSYYTIPKEKNNYTSINDKVFLENKKEFTVLKNHYLDESVRDKVNSVTGYIPYLKLQTSIYFYHFFSFNYGLRKTLIGQLSLVDERDTIKKVSVIKFPSRFNGVINLEDVFGETDAVSCILEVYHPRIFNNHGGHQGHLRFFGVYGKDISTVHSMPLFPFIVKNDAPKLAERRFYPKGNTSDELYFYNFNLKSRSLHKGLEGDLSLKHKEQVGYTIQLEKNINKGQEDFPSSIWHHGPLRRNSFLNKNDIIRSQQLISLPKVNNIDCQLFFGEYIIDKQEVELNLFSPNIKDKLSRRTFIDVSSGLQISGLFDIKNLSGSYILVKPIKNNGQNLIKGGYINIQYIVDKTRCDGVHSHPFTFDNPSQGLKFMHYKIDESCESYLSVWGLKKSSVEFRMRIIDSRNRFEKCFNLKIDKNDPVLQLNLRDFGIESGDGIVQIECDKYNPHATSFIYKTIDCKSFLSVCHLTGG